jgi:hypothetical protein
MTMTSDEKLDAILKGIEELKRGKAAWEASAAATKARDAGRPVSDGVCFPNYGRSKGAPVKGASASDLAFYRQGCERTLADPEKSRWHERELVLLAAIKAEQGDTSDAPPHGDADAPPPEGDVLF